MVGMNTWVAALAVFWTVASGTIALVLGLEWLRNYRRRHGLVRELQRLANQGLPGAAPAGELLREVAAQGTVSRLAARVPQFKDLEILLQQAGSRRTVGSFLVLSAGMGACAGLVALVLSRSASTAAACAAVAALLPWLALRRKRAVRFRAFEEQLPDAIDLLGRAIRAGHPLTAGLKMVADECREPIAPEFRQVFEQQRFGMPFDEALHGLVDRVPIVDVRILATAVMIQREVGGNLAEILDNLAHVIRARFTIRRQLRVYTAQGRMTGYLLAMMPIVLFSILYVMNREFMSLLFTDPIGRMLVATGITLQLLGFLWIRKIVNIEI